MSERITLAEAERRYGRSTTLWQPGERCEQCNAAITVKGWRTVWCPNERCESNREPTDDERVDEM